VKKCLVTMMDDGFMVGWRKAFGSFLQHNPWFSHDFIVIDLGLSEENKKELLEKYAKTKFFLPRKEAYSEVDMRECAEWLRETYYKLEVFRLTEYDLICFLDMDILVLQDLSELFSIKKKGIHACHSYAIKTDKLSGYFNSGVFVLVGQASEDNHKKAIEIAKKGHSMPDQKVLNMMYSGNINYLPKKYNVEKRVVMSKSMSFDFDRDVAVIHYVGSKPWQEDKRGDNQKEYLGLEKYWHNWGEKEVSYKYKKICIRNARGAKSGLVDLIKHTRIQGCVGVEIGSYVGDSSQIFCESVKMLYCVDPWEDGYDDSDAASYQYPMSEVERQFDENMSQFKNYKKIKSSSFISSRAFSDESLDFIYIDGLHTYEGVVLDIKIWRKKIKRGGWICGHDYCRKFKGVMRAVDEAFGKPDAIFSDTSWAVQVK